MDTMVNGERISSTLEEVRTPLPRGDGAEAPQSELPPGATPLEYTEQNFNELVAANTAMQNEIANQGIIIADLRERLADAKVEAGRFETIWSTINGKLERALKDVGEEREAHAYTKALLDAERRRTERAKGYIDRVIDQEASLDPAPTRTMPLPRSPIGPGINSISDPQPPTRNGERMPWMSEARLGEAYHESEQRRRY